MQFVWTLIRAAVQFIKLRDLSRCLEDYVATIARSNRRRKRKRQREQMGLAAHGALA